MKVTIDIPRRLVERIRADFGHGYIPHPVYESDNCIIQTAIFKATTPPKKDGKIRNRLHKVLGTEKAYCPFCNSEHELNEEIWIELYDVCFMSRCYHCLRCDEFFETEEMFSENINNYREAIRRSKDECTTNHKVNRQGSED